MKLLAVLTAALLSSTVFAASHYHTENIMLLQPESVLQERVPSVQEFAQYTKAVQSAAESALATEQPHPASGYIVLAVRPGGHSMAWLDFKPGLPEKTAAKLRAAILAVPTFEVRGGVVVFALNASLWGSPASQGVPNPKEWSKAMEGSSAPMEIGDLVDKVWPAAAGT
jgi:hypothetical protein